MPYADPQKRRESRVRLYASKTDQVCAKIRAHRAANPDQYRNNALKRRYGITLEQFDSIIEAQNGKCALCEEALKLGTKSVHVDHCHETGKVRGVLCARCNLGIGRFGDNILGLERAIEYLKRSLG